MNMSRRHHYVPKLILKRFVDEFNRIHCFDARNTENGVFSTNIMNVLIEGNFHTRITLDGCEDVEVEKYFSRIESEVAPVVDKIVSEARNGRRPQLTIHEREIWNRFFYYQWKRSPDLIEKISLFDDFDQDYEEAIRRYDKIYKPLTESERQNFLDPENRERQKKNIIITAMAAPSSDVMEHLEHFPISDDHIRQRQSSWCTRWA